MSVYEEKESYAASRSGGIGGTDAAAILGLSPWKTPIEVYESKVNPDAVPELDKEMLWWGSALEPIVRGRYAEKFGVSVYAPDQLGTLFPRTRPWRDSTIIIGDEPWKMAAPDGWIHSADRTGLEVKCAARKSDEWGTPGSDQVPAHYLIQDMWYMPICEAVAWDYGVLFAGNTLADYKIHLDAELVKNMVEVCRAFWHDNVLKQVEPPIDQSESYGRYLAPEFSLSTGQVITNPSDEILGFAAEMRAASDQVKVWEDREREANNNLRALIGEAQKAVTPLGTLGWVRPEMKSVTDWAQVGKAAGPLHPEIVSEFTKDEQRASYLRAWWKK